MQELLNNIIYNIIVKVIAQEVLKKGWNKCYSARRTIKYII